MPMRAFPPGPACVSAPLLHVMRVLERRALSLAPRPPRHGSPSQPHGAASLPVCRLLTKDPKKRPDARDALGHPWLKATGSKLALEGNDPYMQTISDEVARNLSKFAASNKLQRAFMHLAVTFIHKNEMQRMLAIFNKLNTDKHTPLPAEDITAILTKGRKASEAKEISDTVEVCPHPRPETREVVRHRVPRGPFPSVHGEPRQVPRV